MSLISQTNEKNNQRIYSLQMLRGIAAIMVVLYHVRGYLIIIGNNTTSVFSVFTEIFSYGALLFLVLSGFLMPYSIEHSSSNFLTKKLIRIFSTYLSIAVVVVITKSLLFSDFNMTLPQLIKSLTLLPFGYIQYPLNVEWTLIYEIFFYFICSFFAKNKSKKYYPYFLLIWFVIIVLSNTLLKIPSDFLPTFSTIFTSMYNGYFILGSFTYYIYKKIDFKHKFTYYILLVFGISSVCLVEYYSKINLFMSQYKSYAFMISLSLIIYTVAKLKININSKINSFIIQVGNYSYAIYLIHVPVIYIIFTVVFRNNIQLNSYIALLALTVALVCGWYFGKFDLFLQSLINIKLKNILKPIIIINSILATVVVLLASYSTLNNINIKIHSLMSSKIDYENPTIGFLDVPANNSTISGTTFTGEGWFLDNHDIVKIELFMDNTYLCDAQLGYPRTGVESIYPGYKNYDKAGYLFYFDTTKFSNGKHLLHVKATNEKGESYSLDPCEIIINN